MKIGTSVVWRLLTSVGVAAAALYAGAEIAKISIYTEATEAKVRTFVHNGVWYTDKSFGNKDATALTRAYVAVGGLLALSREETVYYLAHTDEGGDPISSGHVYEIAGTDMPARWWSITLYNADRFLTPNPQGKYSVKGTDITRDKDGSFRIVLSREARTGNWIPMGEGENMSLLLRMYNPEPQVRERLADIELPVIRKVEK